MWREFEVNLSSCGEPVGVEKARIKLWGHVGLVVIVEWLSGTLYSNQTGGTDCLHPEFEGVLVPLRNRMHPDGSLKSPETELNQHFLDVHAGSGATYGLDEDDADFIDNLLQDYRLSQSLRVDRSRLNESHEAWVFAELLADDINEFPIFTGLGPYPRKAVLSWTNSD